MRIKNGFTLMEMLIVVAIIGVLVAISIPVFASMQTESKQTVCDANRRSLKSLVYTNALLDGIEPQAAFNALYPSLKDEYPCPEGGTFSFNNGNIECSKHTETSVGSVINLSDKKVLLATGTEVFEPEQTSPNIYSVNKGSLYKYDGNIYVAAYDSNSQISYLIPYVLKIVNINNKYTVAELDKDNKGKPNGGNPKVAIGSVYEYEGILYVQIKSVWGCPGLDPRIYIDYWTPLGTFTP